MIAIGAFTRSSSFRVGALFTALSSAGILFIFYFWSLADDDKLLAEAHSAIAAEKFLFSELYRSGDIEQTISSVNRRVSLPSNDTLVALYDSNQKILAGNLQRLPDHDATNVPVILSLPITEYLSKAVANDSYLATSDYFLIDDIPLGEYRIMVARSVEALYSTQKIGRALGWLFIVMLVMIAALSFGVAIYVVNRINRMSRTASDIMDTGNLAARMEIDSNWDDLSRLAIVFNKTLDKIENSVKNIKQVSDNIAHDLRTPLTRLRGKLERMPDSELRDDAMAEADNLLGIFNSLLRIADVESERQRAGFERVALHTVVNDVIDLYEPLLEDQQVRLTTNIDAVEIEGDPHLLFQALSNLVDNSLKHAKSSGRIEVLLKQYGNRNIIAIFDSGRGLPTAEFENLDRRFYRAEQSRTTPGNGLGLSMVSAVTSLHYGTLWFVDNPLCETSGFGVVMSLPVRSSKSLSH
ncbi:sensor histidine kinase [Alteromonas confluentis]|uniref:histidine kinase n=1 Tax=Alteromonas confluentis TaxID=1656094 RepID=A0A1E7ZCT1_9ALTE|nr:ATP-binding protein [Alteromonas confluentis]OFC71262.1 hypothetical protein BFC18_08875 [Alteromonas confluentis]